MGAPALIKNNTSSTDTSLKSSEPAKLREAAYTLQNRTEPYYMLWTIVGESQAATGTVSENTFSNSKSDIAQQVQSVMNKPQRKTDLFRMAGVIKEPFSDD